ncbi:response regulator transcription factor [Nitrosomonas sp. JL21]|uniref:AraC family transcriptional regulator n=1 Tax=Nitrosomonas sp. JL21 TaxID=153949 RepID=UPI00136F4706|nr:response regulator transcription factor [Nitrosomonas sp. JL21]MBL8496323.1 response regulator transcription factor [Nitrosomonas sp.]
MKADEARVAWITLCKNKNNAQDIDISNEDIAIYRVHEAIDKHRMAGVITHIKPNLICLDFDFPDLPDLQLLRQIRSAYSTIPVIMLTVQHSENLAVWAFRTGVRNYLVKPLSIDAVLKEMAQLAAPRFNSKLSKPRINLMRHYQIPPEFHFISPARLSQRTLSAVNYVAAHFHEKITAREMAALCGMSVFTFSRQFRVEHHMTFREFLIRYRITQAKEFLRNPQITITDVAQLSGFTDTSSFAKLFRRHNGMTPSSYQKKHAARSN